jgi:lysophospholipase L1-like esterase
VAPDPVESLDGSAQVVSFPAPTVTGGQPPLTTGCQPASGATFPVGSTTVTCTSNDAKARTATCSFPVVVTPPPKLSATSFVAFGDSITWGEDGTNTSSTRVLGQRVFVQLPPGERYPDILQQELQARYKQQMPTVFNAGCPGEMLSAPGVFNPECYGARMDDPSAYRRFLTVASLKKFDAVLFMEGSNDVDAAAGDSTVLPVAVSYLQKMIDAAKSNSIKVVVATIPPMVPPGADSRAKGYAIVPTYNDMVRALATSETVPLTDVYGAFGSSAASLIGFDGLHPNPSGYQAIADTFFSTIKSSLDTATTSKQATRRRR